MGGTSGGTVTGDLELIMAELYSQADVLGKEPSGAYSNGIPNHFPMPSLGWIFGLDTVNSYGAHAELLDGLDEQIVHDHPPIVLGVHFGVVPIPEG